MEDKNALDRRIEQAPVPLRKFILYIYTIAGKEYNTVRSYYYVLKNFFVFIAHKYALVDKKEKDEYIILNTISFDILNNLTNIDIQEYLYYCARELNYSASSRSNHLTVLKRFFSYLKTHENLIDNDPAASIEYPKLPKKLPKYLTIEQSKRLLNAVSQSDDKYRERNYCMILLFLMLGLRVSEMSNINLKDISLADNTIRIHGKGNKERTLSLNKDCQSAIKNYLVVRPNDDVKDKQALFLNRSLNRISTKQIERITKKYLTIIGLPDYTCHKLRHTAATLIYSEKKDIRTTQEILGHSSISSTEIYTHINNKEVEEAINNHPLQTIKN